jgi:hypothetical protein
MCVAVLQNCLELLAWIIIDSTTCVPCVTQRFRLCKGPGGYSLCLEQCRRENSSSVCLSGIKCIMICSQYST